MKKVIAIVGMAGSGKSVLSGLLEQKGCTRIRFGDITDSEIHKRGLALNEENERQVRELLRRELGMAAYAILNRPVIDKALQTSDVVVDGLYSWEEYLTLKDYYQDQFYVISVFSSPNRRYARLTKRNHRPLTAIEAASRDKAEIENLNKGGPIAMADYTILNESNLENFHLQASAILDCINNITRFEDNL